MRIFHIQGDQFDELQALPDALPARGYLWVGCSRPAFERRLPEIQGALQRWTGTQLVDLHVSDLLNAQLPSNFDYTSSYDLLSFRRLAAIDTRIVEPPPRPPTGLSRIDTTPIGFAVFERVLLSVHPEDCAARDFFANRLRNQTPSNDSRSSARMAPSPADLALRMVNFLVDSYLDLRRLLTRQLDLLQQELFSPSANAESWTLLLESRNSLHVLEDTCEDQRAAITEWIDAYDELEPSTDAAVIRERELLRIRARDVLEHIERVLTHVRRLEASAENAVQMHFSAQSNRTNEIMRTLTVLTAIFLPLNLVTGFFGMNFEGLPLIHSAKGFWWTFGFMLIVGIGLSWYFVRKRYLASPPK